MRILLISNNPDNLNNFLTENSYEVRNCQSTNLAEKLLKSEDIVIFCEDVVELVISQDDVLRNLGNAGNRIILVCDKNSNLVPVASAFGVKDFLFYPTSPQSVLSRIKNPASSEIAADALSRAKEQEPAEEQKVPWYKKVLVKLPKQELIKIKKQRDPVVIKECLSEATVGSGQLTNPFGVRDGLLEEVPCTPNNTEKLLDYSAIFLPDSWSAEDIKKIRRKPQAKSIYIVVVGQNRELLTAGADRSVPEINDVVIEEVTFATERLTNLWVKAETDDLTGCYTRDFWDSWLREQKNQQILICDIDHFKKVNDTYGHPFGDVVLKEFANFLQVNIRPADILCRWGGEEFVIGMPGTTAAEAHYAGVRLCEKWEQISTKLFADKKLVVTFSGGVGDTVETADQSLYKAKEAGRNRIISAVEEPRMKQVRKVISPTIELVLGSGYQVEEVKKVLLWFSLKKSEPILICDLSGEIFPEYPRHPAEPEFWAFDLPGGEYNVVQAEDWQIEQIAPDITILHSSVPTQCAAHIFSIGKLHKGQHHEKLISLSDFPHKSLVTLPLNGCAVRGYLRGCKSSIILPTKNKPAKKRFSRFLKLFS